LFIVCVIIYYAIADYFYKLIITPNNQLITCIFHFQSLTHYQGAKK